MLSRKVIAVAPARVSLQRVSAPPCRAAPRPRRQPVLVAGLRRQKRDEKQGVTTQETFLRVTNLLMAAIIIGSGARFTVNLFGLRGDVRQLRDEVHALALDASYDSLGAKINAKFDALMQQEQQAAARRRDAARE